MRIARATALFVLPMTLGLLLAACGGGGSSAATGSTTGGGGGTPSTCPLPAPIAAPRFSTDILPALQASCGSASISCHGNANPPAGHIRYDTNGRTPQAVLDALVNVAPSSSPAGWVLVKPGDPAKSWIIEKVTASSPGGGGYGTRMPQAAPDLCQASVDNLKAWIQAGAPF